MCIGWWFLHIKNIGCDWVFENFWMLLHRCSYHDLFSVRPIFAKFVVLASLVIHFCYYCPSLFLAENWHYWCNVIFHSYKLIFGFMCLFQMYQKLCSVSTSSFQKCSPRFLSVGWYSTPIWFLLSGWLEIDSFYSFVLIT